MLVAVDKIQGWEGAAATQAARPLLTVPPGVSSSAPGSTASRHTLTSTTGGRWCWTCRSGEPSSPWGPGVGRRGTLCGNSQFEAGVAYTYCNLGCESPSEHSPPPLSWAGLEHKFPAWDGEECQENGWSRRATAL